MVVVAGLSFRGEVAFLGPDRLSDMTFGGAVIDAWRGGSLIRVQRERELRTGGPKGGGGRRGSVTQFTHASRRRLLRTIARLDRAVLPLFATLTYPGEYNQAPAAWKRDLKVWADRLRRRFPGAAFVWRLELQGRGAPHFHLLLYGIPSLDGGVKEWLSSSWYEVVGSNDERHLRAGTNIQPIRSHRGVMAYSGKELGKVTQAHLEDTYEQGVGRWWGASHRAHLPWAAVESMQLSERDAVGLLRLARRFAELKCPSRDYRSLTIFCDADAWWANLPRLLGGATESSITTGLARLAQIEQDIRRGADGTEVATGLTIEQPLHSMTAA